GRGFKQEGFKGSRVQGSERNSFCSNRDSSCSDPWTLDPWTLLLGPFRMLRELRIRDFAIIDDLALSFDAGLNVLTGETGAGKSIILQALGLLCGARGAADLIRSDADEASIEGLFDCSLPEELREGLGVTGDEIVVRRHLARNGKSRVYVNGSPAT